MHENLVLVVLMLGAGWLSARLSWLPETAAETLNRFVVYVCLPALVLSTVPGLVLRWELLWVVATPWLLAAFAAPAVLALGRLWQLRPETTAALLLCIPLGNTSFLGYPMLESLVGRHSIQIAVLYDQFGSFLLLSTYGFFVLARYGGGPRASPLTVLKRVVTFPSFIALCLGLLVPHVPVLWPPVAQGVAARLGDTLVPLAMFAVGLKMQLRAPRPRRAFAVGLVLKLVVMPALALGVVGLAGLHGVTAQVIVLESAMPSMITAGALAIMAGFAPELAAALVGYGILVSMITLPLWASLL